MPQKTQKHGRATVPAKTKRDDVRVCLMVPRVAWERIKAAAAASDQSACRYVRQLIEVAPMIEVGR